MHTALRPVLVMAVLAAVGLRVVNAFSFPVGYGFDAEGNWAYIEHLLGSWGLPAPDAGWSTSHPPLFYYLAAAVLRALGRPEKEVAVPILRVAVSVAGLGMAPVAAWLARWRCPARPLLPWIAALLVLYVPAHIVVSAMLNEELVTAFLVSLGVVGACRSLSEGSKISPAVEVGIGMALGAGLLTKLSAAAPLLAVAASYGLAAAARGDGGRAARLGLVLLSAGAISAWYYVRNWWLHGYFYPHGLETHALMRGMPPGHREILDYLRIPLATWTDPQVLAPDLLRSVWGSTWATLWFDGHRHFLPREDPRVEAMGAVILALAVVPALAFARGLAHAVARLLGGRDLEEAPLVLLVVSTLAGYVAFTWRNPWFAVLKGSYLLGLSVPFAFYAARELDAALRRPRWRWVVAGVLVALLVLVAVTFTQGLLFEKAEPPGLPWYRTRGN